MGKNIILPISFFAFIFICCKSNSVGSDIPKITNAVEKTQLPKEASAKKKNLKFSEKTYFLDDLKITLSQTKGDGEDFYCKSNLKVYRGSRLIDSLEFTSNPVGGDFGISKPIQIQDHLIFTKHGDYDGRTIILNKKGKLFNIIGGINYYDPDRNLLFSSHESDESRFAVFDLKSDTLLFKIQELENNLISFHKAFGEKYYVLFENHNPNEKQLDAWEIDFELKKINPTDLDISTINQETMLITRELENINCECEA